MIWICLSLILVSFALSLPLTWQLIHAGRRWGQLDMPDAPGTGGRKNHAVAIPSTGGIAIFVAIITPIIAMLAAVWLLPVSLWEKLGPFAAIVDYLPGIKEQTPSAVGLLVVLSILHVMGLIDDRKHLGPFLKLGIQLAAAASLAIFFDVRILHLLEPQWGITGTIASVVITVLWMVVITNAMNFLDNMDGLTGGVAAIIAAMFLAATLISGQWFIAALAALLLGSLIGFLCFNFPPAKVFMGDGGSLVVGMLLAVISIRTTYFYTNTDATQLATQLTSELTNGHIHAILTPLILLAVPLYDFTSVTLIRISQGRSPFVGDHSHFSHRLVRKGLSKRTAVLVIWLCTLATGLSGVMLGSLTTPQAIVVGVQTLLILAVLAMLERTRPSTEV